MLRKSEPLDFIVPESLEDKCDFLEVHQSYRMTYIRHCNGVTQRAGALARRTLGWKQDPKEMTEADKKRIKTEAAHIVNSVLVKGEECPPFHKNVSLDKWMHLSEFLKTSVEVFPIWARKRSEFESRMIFVAKSLPAYKWAETIKGFGPIGLASIIGEAGNLFDYPTADALKKRLGLAPFTKNGVTKACSSWIREGGLSVDDWKDRVFGPKYKPERRGTIHGDVTDPLFRQQWRNEEKAAKKGKPGGAVGPYGEYYARERAKTERTHPEWKPLHHKQHALRVMTQKLVCDLWSQWREAGRSLPEEVKEMVPSAYLIAAE